MAVYYKFKSAKEFDSIPMDGAFISVGTLKEKIFESKHLSRGTDFDLVVTNAHTNEEFLDDAQIPKNTSVLIRRVPGRPRMPIVAAEEPRTETKIDHAEPENISMPNADPSSVMKYPDDSEWEEFGSDLYSIPEALPVQSNNVALDVPPSNKADEDSKIKALIDTPALDWQRQGSDSFVPGRGFGRGLGGRGAGRGFGLERKTPPQGYVCHRCKVPGHFIQHCPTNGDPNYDIKRAKPPTGIPRSMLQATPDGSYALPSGANAVLKPNEDAFEKEVGVPSTRSVGDLPPELHCPLCKEVMKDAVLTSKCCFKSFCDKCIRDYIISNSMCVCGARNILADDLLPNKTLRDTINRILESGNSSAENAGSTIQVQDMESARCVLPKVPSPTVSAASKGEQRSLPAREMSENMIERTAEVKTTIPSQQSAERLKAAKVADASEATHESASARELTSQGSALPAEEEVQQKVASMEAGKKKKKKKVRVPANDFQWKPPHDLPVDYGMPLGSSTFNPYWPGPQPGFDAFMPPYGSGMPYMNYPMGPMDMPYPGVIPPDPFGPHNYMFPQIPPQRDLADFGMGMNMVPPVRSREEFEARKAELRRNREREFSRDRELGKDSINAPELPSIPRYKPTPQPSSGDHRDEHQRSRSERSSQERLSRDIEPPFHTSKRKSSHHHDREHGRRHEYDDYDYDRAHEHDRHHHHRPESPKLTSETLLRSASTAVAPADKKHKPSVFSRISYPEEEPSKKRSKHSFEAPTSSSHHKSSSTSNGYYDEYKKAVSTSVKRGSSSTADYESSDEDRHFKRKPSRYEASPSRYEASPPSAADREECKQSRSSKDHERSSGSRRR